MAEIALVLGIILTTLTVVEKVLIIREKLKTKSPKSKNAVDQESADDFEPREKVALLPCS
ncbi:hypothetical protein I5R48_13510 [Bacillus velezensis]|nr:hypothetical protein I5R48_13510 [Bacillus velezensis]